MKKLLLISTLAVIAVSCSNNHTEAQEEQKRDSMDNVQVDDNQRLVDSIERADEARQKDTAHHDAAGHEGHNH